MITAPQNTEAGRWLRRIPRNAWRILARAERITVREAAKSASDMMIFGTGYMTWGDFGAPKRDGSDVCRCVEPALVFVEGGRA